MSAAKRPASDTFKNDKMQKKQKMEGNHDITIGDGIYKDSANAQPEIRSLPSRPSLGAKQSKAVVNHSAASSEAHGAAETKRLFHAVFKDTEEFVGHLHQIHPPMYQTSDMMDLWHHHWNRFQHITPTTEEYPDQPEFPTTDMEHNQKFEWMLCKMINEPYYKHHGRMTIAKVFSAVSKPSSNHDLAKALLSFISWDWICNNEYHMYEDFGALWASHVRTISALAAMRSIYDTRYKTFVMPRLVKEAFAWENVWFEEVWDIIKDNKAFEKDFFAVLEKVMRTKKHILISVKAHNLFYPSVGTPFDPASMEATHSNSPLAISLTDAHKYQVVLCVWPGLVTSEEDLSRLKVPYKQVSYPKVRDKASDGPYIDEASIVSKDWMSEEGALWKKLGFEVVGRAVVMVERIAG